MESAKLRLYGVIIWVALGGILLLFLGAHSGIVPRPWVKAIAAVGILEMICVGWWASKKHHLSIALLLLLVGCTLCFLTMFLPFNENSKTILLNVGASFLVLSFLTRFLMLLRLVAKRH
jgi:hypothetical protein